MTSLNRDNFQAIEELFCSQEESASLHRKKWQTSVENILTDGKKLAQVFDKSLNTTEYGKEVLKTRLNWKHRHHGKDHELRVSSFTDVQLLLANEFSIKWKWKASILGLMLFPTFHDFTQIASISFNDTLSKSDLKLMAYQGHGETAALHLLALKRKFMDISFLTQIESENALSSAILMILIHERSNDVDVAFQGKQQAANLSSEELIRSYISNTLDLFSLREKDIVTISLNALRHVKSNKRPFISEKTPFGLHPLFENDSDIRSELTRLSKSDTLLFDFEKNVDADKQEIMDSVRIATNIAVNADNLDMIAPPGLSFLRTLTGSLSMERPLLQGEANDIIYSIRHDKERVSITIDSDVRRKWYEISEIPKTIYESILSESLFITNYMQFLQWRSAKTLKEYTEVFIKGDDDEITKYLYTSLKDELNSLPNDNKNEIFLNQEVDYILHVLKQKPETNREELKKYTNQEKEILQRVNSICIEDIKSSIKKDIREVVIPMNQLLPYTNYIS